MYVDTKEPSKVTLEPTLRNLAIILRNREMWPKGFVWDYNYVSTCAMGLCQEMWNQLPYTLSDVRPSFTDEELNDIFWHRPSLFWCLGRLLMGKDIEVTPEIIADRIDRYLKAA